MKREELYLAVIDSLSDGVYFVDVGWNITFWNAAAEQITGYMREEIIGQRCQDNLLNHIDKDGRQLCVLGCPLHETLLDGKHRKAEVFLRHKDGRRIPVIINISAIYEEGRIVGAVEIFTPSSPVVYEDDLVERLSNMALSDPLTGLANRRKLESYIEYRLHELKRFGRKFCLAFLDIDDFGLFNNSYGHNAGDEILKGIANSVSHSMRASDLFGRWGGEEFIGVFEVKNDKETALLAQKLCVLVAGVGINHGGVRLSVTASIGATAGLEDDTVQTLVERADGLMYRSKNNGKNRATTDSDVVEA